jgi:hypothetical protein
VLRAVNIAAIHRIINLYAAQYAENIENFHRVAGKSFNASF